MLGETWEHQYRRLQRQHGLLKRSADPNGDYNELLHDPEYARDILFHFCLDALNLRDWISDRGASVPPSVRRAVRGELFDFQNHASTASLALVACHDIAIGYKHFRVDHPRTPGGAAEVVVHARPSRLPWKLPIRLGVANGFTIDMGGGVLWDGVKLANDATTDWDRWLTGKGVPLPT